MSRLAAVTLALALAATTARADTQTASTLYAEGQQAYQAQNFSVAAAKFVAAFEADPDPVYLFNAAQAYRFGNECAKSADYYRRFLEKVPNPPSADKVKVWHEDMESCAKTRAAAQNPPPPPVVVNPAENVRPLPDEPRPETGTPMNKKRLAAIIVGAAGVASLGAATYFALDSRSASKEQDRLCPTANCTWDDNLTHLQKRGERANTLGYVTLGIGAVAVAASVGLFLWSRGDGASETAPPVAFVPTSGGGLLVHSFDF